MKAGNSTGRRTAALPLPIRSRRSPRRALARNVVASSKLPSPAALIGRLSVPRLHLSAMVREGIDRNTLQLAIGHIPATALPGQAGNVGVAGHRDTFFRGLKDLKTGDEIQFSTLSGDFKYAVESLIIVEPDNVAALAPSSRERADAGDLLSIFLYRGRAQAVRRKGQAGVAANGWHDQL